MWFTRVAANATYIASICATKIRAMGEGAEQEKNLMKREEENERSSRMLGGPGSRWVGAVDVQVEERACKAPPSTAPPLSGALSGVEHGSFERRAHTGSRKCHHHSLWAALRPIAPHTSNSPLPCRHGSTAVITPTFMIGAPDAAAAAPNTAAAAGPETEELVDVPAPARSTTPRSAAAPAEDAFMDELAEAPASGAAMSGVKAVPPAPEIVHVAFGMTAVAVPKVVAGVT